jgi:hypothetical protein
MSRSVESFVFFFFFKLQNYNYTAASAHLRLMMGNEAGAFSEEWH